MPRPTPPGAAFTAPPKAMISSAAMVSGVGLRNYRKFDSWQQECWYFRDTIGELRYAVSWFANALSRATIKVARADAKGVLQEITTGSAVDTLNTILGGNGDQSQMLKAMGEHYFIAGEWYIVGRGTTPQDDLVDDSVEEVWEVVAAEAMKKKGERWWVDYSDGSDKYEIEGDDAVFRVWNPHPRTKNAPDSPVRAILPTLSEIEQLTLHIKSQVSSRLAGAGVLFISQDITFATPVTDNESTDASEGADPFMMALGRAMAAAKANPDSAEAMVPIIVRVPGEQIDKQRHMQFWSALDAAVGDMRDRAIRRAALGIDLPPEILLGTADVNHWGSWQIDESTIKAHVEPALELMTAALTRILRRVEKDPDVVAVYDTSALRLRPNRSKEAIELFDRNQIGAVALRRETGFAEGDAPKPDEQRDWLLRKVASGSANPEQVEQALNMLDIPITTPDADTGMRESRPDPSLREHPTVGPPEMAVREHDAQRAALEATCDALVYRALERAGNRLKNRSKARADGVEACEMHLYIKPQTATLDMLMEGAWTSLPQLLRNQSFAHETVQRALDSYVRLLLTEQQQHNPEAMMRFIDAGVRV